jgi:hypothetical protein
MREFNVMAIIVLVISALFSLCWTTFYFERWPDNATLDDGETINWPHVLFIFGYVLSIPFTGGVVLGSIPLIIQKLIQWLRQALSRPPGG